MAIQQALRQALHGNCVIKGCWFHFCQAILKHIGSIGLKAEYDNSFEFKFWVKRFMALALIPVDKIQCAINIIIYEIDLESDLAAKQIEFFEYFVSQWCNAKKIKQGPEIWNQHKATVRNNNPSEIYHSTMPSNIPRHHHKEQNVIASDKFLKLNNYLTKSQSVSSKKQIEFNFY